MELDEQPRNVQDLARVRARAQLVSGVERELGSRGRGRARRLDRRGQRGTTSGTVTGALRCALVRRAAVVAAVVLAVLLARCSPDEINDPGRLQQRKHEQQHARHVHAS